jgi:transcriptional regulator with XRE-family HTH domain
MRYNGHAIRWGRKLNGLSVSELANRAGIKQPHMSLIEAGKRQPSEEVGLRIARLLGADDLRSILWAPGPDPIPVTEA